MKAIRKRHRRRIVVLLLLAAILLTAFSVYFLAPGWLPFRRMVAVAVNAQPVSEPDPGYLAGLNENQVTSQEVEAAIQNNYNENFQTCFDAAAAYVVDDSGNVLYAKNEHTRLYPASTTKMMTAYLALEHTEDLDQIVTVASLDGCYEEDSMILDLQPGDQISMRDLLYALLLCSYNDAAAAIAMEISGSIPAFAELMNQQAQAIGAVDTHFVSPHGLHSEDHYTTAYDLNLVLQMAYRVETIRELMITPEATISLIRDGEAIAYDLTNYSYFLRNLYTVPDMPYLAGKTGYTSKAGSCLASVFEHKGAVYYSTVMKSRDASYMTALLFDYYFAPEVMPAFSKTEPLLHNDA